MSMRKDQTQLLGASGKDCDVCGPLCNTGIRVLVGKCGVCEFGDSCSPLFMKTCGPVWSIGKQAWAPHRLQSPTGEGEAMLVLVAGTLRSYPLWYFYWALLKPLSWCVGMSWTHPLLRPCMYSSHTPTNAESEYFNRDLNRFMSTQIPARNFKIHFKYLDLDEAAWHSPFLSWWSKAVWKFSTF